MSQFLFFSLFLVALLAGIYACYHPTHKFNPIEYISDQSGYSNAEDTNRKKIEQSNIITTKGLVEVHRQMQVLADNQQRFADMLEQAQRVLKTSGKQATQILGEAQQVAQKEGKDVLGLKDLSLRLQNQQQLLVQNGQNLIAMNNNIIKERDWVQDQLDLVDTNHESTQQLKLQQQFTQLQEQASTFIDKVTQYDQQTQQHMRDMQEQLDGAAQKTIFDNKQQQLDAKERVRRMLHKQRGNMTMLSDIQQRSRDLLNEERQDLAFSQELLKESMENAREKMAEERQKNEDQQAILKEKVREQMQHLKDQEDMRKRS